jgi:hypothetical protein
MQCQENKDDLPNCGIKNILNSKGTVKESDDPNKNYYCFYEVPPMEQQECMLNSDNIKSCMKDIQNLSNPPLKYEKVWDILSNNGILPKTDKNFIYGFSQFDGTCLVPDKYLKNPPEKVDSPPITPPFPFPSPSPNINPYSDLTNILNNIFNNKNFDINDYKDTLTYLDHIKPSDIKKYVASYIQTAKKNNSYKDARQNIIKIFNILNKNKDIIDLSVNFSVDIINDLQSLLEEINEQMNLDDSQKFNLDIDNIKNNLIFKLKNSDDSDNSVNKNNCRKFSTESIIIISILIFLVLLFIILWILKK